MLQLFCTAKALRFGAALAVPLVLAAALAAVAARVPPLQPSSSPNDAPATAEPLKTHELPGTVSVGIPEDWALDAAADGSMSAHDAKKQATVAYNLPLHAIDFAHPRREFTPLDSLPYGTLEAPYTTDPIKAWITLYRAFANKDGYSTAIDVIQRTSTGDESDFSGTLEIAGKTLAFVAHAHLVHPNDYGLWTLRDTHIFLDRSYMERNGPTAIAVSNSFRTRDAQLAKETSAVKEQFEEWFERRIPSPSPSGL